MVSRSSARMKGRALCLAMLVAGCGLEGGRSGDDPRRRVSSAEYGPCFNGIAFFTSDLDGLAGRLPEGFEARDGSMLREEFAGQGMVAVSYVSCDRADGTSMRSASVATPVEAPFPDVSLPPVAWSWYELARFEEVGARLTRMTGWGFPVEAAHFQQRAFSRGDSVSEWSIAAVDSAGMPVEIAIFGTRNVLTDHIEMPAQAHRFWHTDETGRRRSVDLEFPEHPASVGHFADCAFGEGLPEALAGLVCSGRGSTEAIEALTITERVYLWEEGDPMPR